MYLLVHSRYYERSIPIATSGDVEKLKAKVEEWLNEQCTLFYTYEGETNAKTWGYDGTEKWTEVIPNDYDVSGTILDFVNANKSEEFYIMEIEVL